MNKDNLNIGPHSHIGKNVKINCPGKFELGPCSYIGDNVVIECWEFLCPGGYLFVKPGVTFGGGSCHASPHSKIRLGRGVFVGDRSYINSAREVTIGDETGLGAGVGIWTHGVYTPADKGFPALFAPVLIEDHVWITGNTQILPSVFIGRNSVISMGSLVNRDIPEGSLAGGSPARIIRKDAFPAPVNLDELLTRTVEEYNISAKWRNIKSFAAYYGDGVIDIFPDSKSSTVAHFDVRARTLHGEATDGVEDFRDFIRRNAGIRFFTGKPFKSIPHPKLKNAYIKQ